MEKLLFVVRKRCDNRSNIKQKGTWLCLLSLEMEKKADRYTWPVGSCSESWAKSGTRVSPSQERRHSCRGLLACWSWYWTLDLLSDNGENTCCIPDNKLVILGNNSSERNMQFPWNDRKKVGSDQPILTTPSRSDFFFFLTTVYFFLFQEAIILHTYNPSENLWGKHITKICWNFMLLFSLETEFLCD